MIQVLNLTQITVFNLSSETCILCTNVHSILKIVASATCAIKDIGEHFQLREAEILSPQISPQEILSY